MKLLAESTKVDRFDIQNNGIQLVENGHSIKIYNDPFRTIPLFITRDSSNELIIFSNFEDYYRLESVNWGVDEVGFWEIVLFGSGLWDRTLYKNVKQMPAATCLTINKVSEQYIIERYWDFDINENKRIDSIEKAAEGLYDRLDNIFSKLDRNQKYVMGLSGGMDSRITLAFLSKYIHLESLELFTYGFDERLLEYKYACEVADALGYNKPKFHKLIAQSYIDAMDYLPQMSGGQIGINHCHITSFLRENKFEEYKQISTYYSDAIFGWDSVYEKNIQPIQENFYASTLKNISFISDEIKKEIYNDSKRLYEGFRGELNYSTLDEYKYVTERNQKFHMFMASIQGRFISNELPYANFELLRYILSIPLKFRAQKQLVDYLLDNYFTNISSRDFRNISSRFQWGSKFAGQIQFYWFKFLNRSNAILRPLTNGRIQLFNKYQTEEHERFLYSDFKSDLLAATEKFLLMGILSPEQKKEFDKLPLRSAGVAERYALISLSKIL